MKRKYIILIAIIIILTVVLVLAFGLESSDNSTKPKTALVEKGTIINTVTATGTVEPVDQVEVGTQVSGVIIKIYTDFNERVKKGQLIAQIDESTLKSRLLQTRASLASAENELDYQQKNYNRIKQLSEKQMVSETDYDEAFYKLNNAKASVQSLKSEVEQAEVNLSYAKIYSPIDGVVLSKSVEEGQTVAASFNTPTLFLIANDLSRMQVEASVDEADIGQVEVGQRVTFTVDAFPDTGFDGEVTQIRLEPEVESNVVTYTVIIDAPNPDLKLKPGLTASVTIITREAKDVPVVPVAALRFNPDAGMMGNMAPPPNMGAPRLKEASKPADFASGEKVWVVEDGKMHPVPVETGLGDGVISQIISGVSIGDSVVTGVETLKASGRKAARSPFMPGPPGGDRKNEKK